MRPQNTTTPGPKVTLAGEGGDSCVVLQPTPLDFGVVAEGMSTTRDVRVLNRCRTDILLSDTSLSTQKGGYFLLAQAPSSQPIPVGQSATLPVTFMPRAGMGAGEAELSVKVLQGHSLVSRTLKVRGSGKVFSPCRYTVGPASVEFGRVPVGSEVALGVALRNTGSTDCYLAGLRLAEGSDAAFDSDRVEGQVLAPGQRAVLHARFKPQAEGSASGLAEGWVNHPSSGHVLVELRGEGVQGCFSVQPTQLDFGVTRLACGPREREVLVYNQCSEPMPLQEIIAEGDKAEFSLLHGLALPANLPAGGSVHMKVTYTPRDDGEDNAALRFDTGSGLPYTVGLRGLGESRSERTDRFVQKSQAQVDVLFVVDNSGSMQDEQQNLGQNLAAFLSHAQATGVDYHIAVTTTGLESSKSNWSACPGGADGGENGRFFPVNGTSPRIITPSTPSAGAVFATNTNVGVCHWNEQGLEGMYRALSAPLVYSVDDPTTAQSLDGNAGFLREEARLAVIAISDEEDFSPRAVSFYETFLKALKGGDLSRVLFSAVVTTEETGRCSGGSSAGSRYMQLARDTGGVVESICTPDWARSLERLSESTFGLNRSFKLGEPLEDPARLSVRVDGVEVKTGWTYDAGTHSVLFAPEAVPAPGAIVEITYPVAC